MRVEVWIHFFIGDTEENNKWLGQYPGNKEGEQRPYCDCKCTWKMLNHTNPFYEIAIVGNEASSKILELNFK